MSAVVLVHGLWMPGWELGLLGRRLLRHGFRPIPFHYASVTATIEQNIDRLQAVLRTLPDEEVHLVGHSLGGLLILRLFAVYPAQRPGRLLALGAPFAGSHVARRLARLPKGRQFLGAAHGLLSEGYARRPEGRDIGVIAGTRPVGIGRLLGGLPKPHDGTVSVAETMLPGALAHLRMDVTHTTIVFSPAVARQSVTFLRYGRFRGEPAATGS